MKVVINSSFGGFGLSDKAVERCLELGMICTAFNKDGNYINENADFCKSNTPTFGHHYSIIKDYSGLKKEFRTNPIVIQVVEELGDEANGIFAKLKIIDIPFETTKGWIIDEYDGMEAIEEEHQSWS